jgi:hypothetical protein
MIKILFFGLSKTYLVGHGRCGSSGLLAEGAVGLGLGGTTESGTASGTTTSGLLSEGAVSIENPRGNESWRECKFK